MKRTILHIVNQSPFDKPCLKQCLQHYSTGDGILFIENGVYALSSQSKLLDQLKGKDCYAIEADTDARGLKNVTDKATVNTVKLVDFNDFVILCTKYDLVQSWY